ncbi:Hypothetical predicted protein [Pelobates cultripes]|uniref:Uncharacterized protein n=1 Tax=Pelobates cultripes TaxID=61616 RepID=A0AAD1RFL9_PELCU|nr:Hypothetical predicted protein [Pelobates cultripes]
MSDQSEPAMSAELKARLQAAIADSIPKALATFRDQTATTATITQLSASDDSRVSDHDEAPQSEPLKGSTFGYHLRVIDEYNAYPDEDLPGNPFSSEFVTETFLLPQNQSFQDTDPMSTTNLDNTKDDILLDTNGCPLFDSRCIRHPRSAEWTPPDHIAKYCRLWLRKPLEKEIRAKLRAEFPRPIIPDKVDVTPELDPLLVTFLTKTGKDPRKVILVGLKATQDKLMDIAGPLIQIFIIADEMLAGGNFDAHMVRKWAQRAL